MRTLGFQEFRTESEASLEDELKEAAEQAAAMRITEKKKERKSSESKDSKKEVCHMISRSRLVFFYINRVDN